MKLLFGGDFIVVSSGAPIRGQMWAEDNGSLKFWDGINWYQGSAVRVIDPKEIRRIYVEDLKKRMLRNPYTGSPADCDSQCVIDEEAWVDWASGRLTDDAYTKLTGKPAKTMRL